MSTIRQDLIRDEGLRLKPYQDTAGKLTIGVGRNLTDVGLSEREARLLLDRDIEVAIGHALEVFPGFHDYPEDVRRVIVNMIFQLGRRGFNGFRRFISHVKNHAWDSAADEVLDSKAARQAPERFARHAQLLRNQRSNS